MSALVDKLNPNDPVKLPRQDLREHFEPKLAKSYDDLFQDELS